MYLRVWQGREKYFKNKMESLSPVGAAETSEELAESRRLLLKRENTMGLLNKKGWPQRHKEQGQLALTPDPPLLKRKRERAIRPNHETITLERANVGKNSTLPKTE